MAHWVEVYIDMTLVEHPAGFLLVGDRVHCSAHVSDADQRGN